MKAPNISDKELKQLKEWKKKNFEERMEFIKKYAEWLKKTPNKEWSKQQNDLIDSQFDK
jgi:hypothetical protein